MGRKDRKHPMAQKDRQHRTDRKDQAYLKDLKGQKGRALQRGSEDLAQPVWLHWVAAPRP